MVSLRERGRLCQVNRSFIKDVNVTLINQSLIKMAVAESELVLSITKTTDDAAHFETLYATRRLRSCQITLELMRHKDSQKWRPYCVPRVCHRMCIQARYQAQSIGKPTLYKRTQYDLKQGSDKIWI
jgi:hypothetical protein